MDSKIVLRGHPDGSRVPSVVFGRDRSKQGSDRLWRPDCTDATKTRPLGALGRRDHETRIEAERGGPPRAFYFDQQFGLVAREAAD